MPIQNPFPLTAYYSPEYFCNRHAETQRLNNNILNGAHTVLISIRRMGKTVLLQHLFQRLSKRKDTYCIYTDIYASQSQKDFLNQLSTAIVKAIPPRKALGKKVLDFVTSLRPVISYDNLTGAPEISFQFSQARQREQSLEDILQFLDSLGVVIVIAIDEFQQIIQYPEKNTEAFLRSLIQPLKNIRFIFSGSSPHVLTQMFNSNKRPFFGSAQIMSLIHISRADYQAFILRKFAEHKRKIDEDALQFICEWSRLHTYYTQVTCNRLFGTGYSHITLSVAQIVCSEILDEQQSNFFQYRNLLTSTQWQVLQAIAKEDKLYQPGAGQFLARYKLGTPSNVKRSLDALLKKEMVYAQADEKGNYYRVYDCFLSRWLERI